MSIFLRWYLLFHIFLPFSVVNVYAENKNGVSPQVLSLPKGPGAIEGLGDAFEPQLNTGMVSYTIPLKAPPGRLGFQPEVSIFYNGGNGNSILGLGWDISIPKIKLKTENGFPSYDGGDIYLGIDGEDLVEIEENVYRSKVENNFSRYEKIEKGWRVQSRSGVVSYYGTDEESRIESGGKTFAWMLEKQVDLSGNEIVYLNEKLDESNQVYLTKIKYSQYGDNYQSVQFSYEERPDKLTDYKSGFPVLNAFRLNSIKMLSLGRLVRRYQINYHEESNLSLLTSIQEFGSDDTSSLPPVTVKYTGISPATPLLTAMEGAEGLILALNPDSGINDMNADGLPDILVAEAGAHRVIKNNGNLDGVHAWSADIYLTQNPSYALGSQGVSLADIDGDGKTDFLAKLSNIEYFMFKNSGDLSWEEPIVFADNTGLPIDFESPNLRLVDINNDKYIDVMITADNGGNFYDYYINSEGKSFSKLLSQPGLGDAITFDQRPELIFSDMNGDRIQDLVLLGDGEIIYWPSMGNGTWDRRRQGDWPTGMLGNGIRMFNPPKSSHPDLAELFFFFDKIKSIDVNGDGLTDLLFQPEDADYLYYWLNKDGITWSDAIRVNDVPVVTELTTVLAADINGNGTVDLLWNFPESAENNPQNTWLYLEFYPKAKPYLLQSISNGIGKTTTFHYGSSVDEYLRDEESTPWVNRLPNPVNVLKELEVSDGINTYVTKFDYHNGFYDGKEKEFRGFEYSEQYEIGDESVPTLISSYEFDLGISEESLKGKMKSLIAGDAEGIFYTEDYTWEVRTLDTSLDDKAIMITTAYRTQRDKVIKEKANGEPVTLRWNYAYDDFGNTLKIEEHGRLDDGWNDERTTIFSYSAMCRGEIGKWVVNKLISKEVREGIGATGKLASRSENYYDDSSRLCDLSRGLVTEVRGWIEENNYISVERKSYDSYGNPILLRDGNYVLGENGNYRSLRYDDELKIFPIEENIHISAENTLTISASYHTGFGVINDSSDFNGHKTRYEYDIFGRIIAITKPLDTDPTIEYSYALAKELDNGTVVNWVETRQREEEGGGTLDSRKYYDGLGRLVMTRSEGEFPGQIVVSDTVQFNAQGVAYRKYLPYFDSGSLEFKAPSFSNNFTVHFYDALGRQVKMVQPDTSFSTVEFEPLVKTVKDEEQTQEQSKHFGAAMRYEEDGLINDEGKGRLRKVTEITPEPWLTQYRYDVLDNFTGYTDSQNNKKHLLYDGLSRKIFMNDPDRGHMYYFYDNASNLTKTIDAKKQTIEYTYDGANRLSAEYYNGDKEASVKYHYDVPGEPVYPGENYNPNQNTYYIDALLTGDYSKKFDINKDGIFDVGDLVLISFPNREKFYSKNTTGKLVWIEDQSGAEYYSYDKRGRKVWVIRKIKDGDFIANYYTGMEHDSMDRVSRLIYPDNSYVEYKYNRRGLLENIPDVISSIDYNPIGQYKQFSISNGIVTNRSFDSRLRLTKLVSENIGNGLIYQNLTFNYDAVSNVISVKDERKESQLINIGQHLGVDVEIALENGSTKYFKYDNSYRLIKATYEDGLAEINYRYDRLGNMFEKSIFGRGRDNSIDDIRKYTFGGILGDHDRNGRTIGQPGGPHAVTNRNGKYFYEYDANGNMEKTNELKLVWDTKDRLISVLSESGESEYTYSYDSRRRIKRVKDKGDVGGRAVYYLSKFSEIRSGKLYNYIFFEDKRIARFLSEKDAGSKLDKFFLHDHMSTTNFMVDNHGEVVASSEFYPFGGAKKSKSINGSDDIIFGFTSKETDVESDLIYFDSRYLHDGRFVSVDLAKVAHDDSLIHRPQQLNLYGYALNNPISNKDINGETPRSVVGVDNIVLFPPSVIYKLAQDKPQNFILREIPPLSKSSLVPVYNPPAIAGFGDHSLSPEKALIKAGIKTILVIPAVSDRLDSAKRGFLNALGIPGNAYGPQQKYSPHEAIGDIKQERRIPIENIPSLDKNNIKEEYTPLDPGFKDPLEELQYLENPFEDEGPEAGGSIRA